MNDSPYNIEWTAEMLDAIMEEDDGYYLKKFLNQERDSHITVKTDDGYVICVYTTMYMDYGLIITKGNEELFCSPHCLADDSYGMKPPDDMGYDEAELNDCLIPWTNYDWAAYLLSDSDELLEAFVCDV